MQHDIRIETYTCPTGTRWRVYVDGVAVMDGDADSYVWYCSLTCEEGEILEYVRAQGYLEHDWIYFFFLFSHRPRGRAI